MSGRLWTPLDQLRLPRWQVLLATRHCRPPPESHADVFDWEPKNLKTRLKFSEDLRKNQLVLDHHLELLVALRMRGMYPSAIATAFCVTRQAIEKRFKILNYGHREASRSSEIPVIQV